MPTEKLIRFDWAIKHILRNKANFDILEGFLSAVLGEDVRVIDLLESEGNQVDAQDKFNRVDLLVKDAKDQLILIEVQVDTEQDFFHRIAYNAAKLIVQYIEKGKPYGDIKKVFTISILYFNLGTGKDYVYHGKTTFVGLHEEDTLQLSSAQKKLYGYTDVYQIYPEHFLLRVETFDDEVQNDLDEWIYLLKNDEVKPEFDAKHIQAAKEKLRVLNLDTKERQAYERYMEDLTYRASMEQSAYIEGIERGLKEGIERGIEQGIERGIERGIEQGIERGIERGIEQGGVRWLRRTIILLLRRDFPNCPADVITRIEQTDDLAQLDQWFQQLLSAKSWQEVFMA